MSWQDVMPIMLRYMINDYASPQVYDDYTLQTAVLVNATFMNQELNFNVIFNIDIMNLLISPDPTGNEPAISNANQNIVTPALLPDYNFVNLTVMRTACMILRNEYKTATNSAIMFREFHTQMDSKSIAQEKLKLLKDMEEIYDRAYMHYQNGIRVSAAAILTPFNIVAGGWRGPIYVYSDRDRFVI